MAYISTVYRKFPCLKSKGNVSVFVILSHLDTVKASNKSCNQKQYAVLFRHAVRYLNICSGPSFMVYT